MTETSGGDYLARALAKLVVWVDSHTVDLPDGCENCGLHLAKTESYDQCPFCGWGPETVPDKTGKEARREFVNRVINNHVKQR